MVLPPWSRASFGKAPLIHSPATQSEAHMAHSILCCSFYMLVFIKPQACHTWVSLSKAMWNIFPGLFPWGLQMPFLLSPITMSLSLGWQSLSWCPHKGQWDLWASFSQQTSGQLAPCWKALSALHLWLPSEFFLLLVQWCRACHLCKNPESNTVSPYLKFGPWRF